MNSGQISAVPERPQPGLKLAMLLFLAPLIVSVSATRTSDKASK
jgi:hypothetical protein